MNLHLTTVHVFIFLFLEKYLTRNLHESRSSITLDIPTHASCRVFARREGFSESFVELTPTKSAGECLQTLTLSSERRLRIVSFSSCKIVFLY